MNKEIIIAGFGGQGVLSMGKTIAYAGLIKGLEVSWMPSYGPEMRGGTANVTVIMSDKKISSPILTNYDTVIALNQPSLDKFESKVKSDGILLFDTNGVFRLPEREDIHCYSIDAVNIAAKMNATKITNMVLLGAYLSLQDILTLDDIVSVLKKTIPERHHDMIPKNIEALEAGMNGILMLK